MLEKLFFQEAFKLFFSKALVPIVTGLVADCLSRPALGAKPKFEDSVFCPSFYLHKQTIQMNQFLQINVVVHAMKMPDRERSSAQMSHMSINHRENDYD